MKTLIRKSILFAAASLFAGALLSAPAQAQSAVSTGPSMGTVGFFAGPSFINNTVTGTGISGGTEILLGGDFTYNIGHNLDIGARFGWESLGSAAVNGANVSSSLWTLQAQANYHFDWLLAGLYSGYLLGVGDGSTSVNGASNSSLNWAMAVQAGYDYPFLDFLSVGLNVNYQIVTGSSGNGNIAEFNLLGMLKYRF
jgi:hypothetical protein